MTVSLKVSNTILPCCIQCFQETDTRLSLISVFTGIMKYGNFIHNTICSVWAVMACHHCCSEISDVENICFLMSSEPMLPHCWYFTSNPKPTWDDGPPIRTVVSVDDFTLNTLWEILSFSSRTEYWSADEISDAEVNKIFKIIWQEWI